MPRKSNPATRGDRTSKPPTAVGDRGRRRPAARRTNRRKVGDAARRDQAVATRR
jgi:hypothetical protein